MKQTIRFNVWETNSSSVHSISICTKEDYDKWVNGELFYDASSDKFTNEPTNKWDEENYNYEDFWDNYCEYYEGFTETFTTPHGDEIVAFGYYGEDR